MPVAMCNDDKSLLSIAWANQLQRQEKTAIHAQKAWQGYWVYTFNVNMLINQYQPERQICVSTLKHISYLKTMLN